MHTELGRWRRAWRRVGKATVDVEVEEEGEEAHEEAEEKEEEESWSRRKRTTLIKSNNPHLAGGEKHLTFGPLLEVEMSKNCTPLWREAHFQVKMYKTHQVRTTFGSSDVEKVHAVVARSTFRSQNVKKTRGSDHFWMLRCRSAWQVQGIVDLVESEQNVRVLQHFEKRWQAWDF